MRAAVVQLVLAVAAAVGSVLSWIAARSAVQVSPILDGEPWTTQWSYSPPMVGLALLLAAAAGVLAVLGIARLRRNNVPGR